VGSTTTNPVSQTNSKMSRVPVTCIAHHPQKFPLLLLKLCSAISFPSGGVRGVEEGDIRCCVLYDNTFIGSARREGG
jgi:hypothetical protein